MAVDYSTDDLYSRLQRDLVDDFYSVNSATHAGFSMYSKLIDESTSIAGIHAPCDFATIIDLYGTICRSTTISANEYIRSCEITMETNGASITVTDFYGSQLPVTKSPNDENYNIILTRFRENLTKLSNLYENGKTETPWARGHVRPFTIVPNASILRSADGFTYVLVKPGTPPIPMKPMT